MERSDTPYQRFVALVYEACHASEAVDYFDLRGNGTHMRAAWAWLLADQRDAFKTLAEHVRDHAEAILRDVGAPPEEVPSDPPRELIRLTDLMRARHDFLCGYAIKAEQAAIAADKGIRSD